MTTFGDELRRLRGERGLSLRALAKLARYDFGYLGQLERGVRAPTAAVAAACDRALNGGGRLIVAYGRQAGDDGMHRRTVLRAFGSLAAGTPSFATLEALRHGVGQVFGNGVSEWEQIVADYGQAYYRIAPEALIQQLTTDLAVLQTVATANDGRDYQALSRAAAQLAVIVAQLLTSAGQTRMACRWWSTARQTADESGDLEVQVLVRAWDVVNGCYDGRPLASVVAQSDEAIALAQSLPTAGSAGLWAGRAQALALSGRRTEAIESVRQVAAITDRLPTEVVNDVESLWGWPEHRPRHTESYVYAQVGELSQAADAQDRALSLYPVSQGRLRTQVGLHRASCLIKAGEVGEGLRYATALIDDLPVEQHNGLMYQTARQVMTAVPATDRGRSELSELAARIPIWSSS